MVFPCLNVVSKPRAVERDFKNLNTKKSKIKVLFQKEYILYVLEIRSI